MVYLKEIQLNNAQATKRKCDFSKPVTYLTLALVIGYACAGAFGAEALTWADKLISPVVDGLHFIGFGIAKPSIDGAMPERFYTNLVGLAIWCAFMYNAMVIAYLVCNTHLSEMGFDATMRRLESQRGWTPIRSWLVLHAAVYLGVLPLGVFWMAALLNGSHGWFVFHTKDIFTSVLTTLVFVFPGAFVSLMVYIVIRGIIFDISRLFILFTRR